MHPFCKLLSSFLNACKGLFLGIFGISTQLLFWSETIDVAEENHLILRWHFRHKQIHSQDILTEASLQSKAVAGDVAMHAALCSASWCCFKVAAHWPNASSTRWGTVFGAHTQQMRCHSVCLHVLCTNCPLLALQKYQQLREAQHRLSKGCNESGSDTFPSRGNPLA